MNPAMIHPSAFAFMYRDGRNPSQPYHEHITDVEKEWEAVQSVWRTLEGKEQAEFLGCLYNALRGPIDEDPAGPREEWTTERRELWRRLGPLRDVITSCGDIPDCSFEDVFIEARRLPVERAYHYVLGIHGLLESLHRRNAEWWWFYGPDYTSTKLYQWSQMERMQLLKLLVGIEEGYLDRFSGEVAAKLKAYKPIEPLVWKGSQVDLVYVMECLMQAGLLSADTTDSAVIQHFQYESESKDRPLIYRQLRAKILRGDSYPSQLVEQLLQLLKNGPMKEK